MNTQNAFSYRSVQYLAITRNWMTEMENFDRESKFFHFLFEDYFLSILSSYYGAKFREMEIRLTKLDKDAVTLTKNLKVQSMILEMMVDGKIKESIDKLQKRQVSLEIEMNSFSRNFSGLKKEIFQLVSSANDCHERFSSPCIEKLV